VSLTASEAAALVVVGSTCDIDNTTLVSNSGCLNHVVSQQIRQQKWPYNRIL